MVEVTINWPITYISLRFVELIFVEISDFFFVCMQQLINNKLKKNQSNNNKKVMKDVVEKLSLKN